MRHPLWVLNSALLILIACVLLFIAFSRQELPERGELELEVTVTPRKDGVPTINLKQIYDRNLFGTYTKPVAPVKEPKYVVPLPEPPKRVPVMKPREEKPKFLDPLQITLRGIMSVSDGSKNKVIISDNKTNRESVYRVGDKIEDAQLIRIFKNKVIFVRSNGQQEVLYLRPEDAKSDPTYLIISDWKGVVRKVAKNHYHIYLDEFAKRVKNLAQFIDILNLTTAYKKGASLGTRVGKTEKDSLASELGLRDGDIILTINGIPATDTKSRLDIYKKITNLALEDSVIVRLQRANRVYTLRYTMSDFSMIKKPTGPEQPVTARYVQEQQKEMFKKKRKLAPTVREIRDKERRTMKLKGKKPKNKLEN